MSVAAKGKALEQDQSHLHQVHKESPRRARKAQVAPAPIDDRVCSICLAAFDQYSVTLHCLTGHAFHSECIGEWLFDQEKTTCPQCIRQIEGKEREVLFKLISMIDRQKIIDAHPMVKCIPTGTRS